MLSGKFYLVVSKRSHQDDGNNVVYNYFVMFTAYALSDKGTAGRLIC